ncbi:hypothetical protein [Paenibacillus aceti]|uniref:Uncharacterized protein n=1 Tax=Paenibacillus aceti TaxID=1820010 RepID=A0ABQ1VPT1_9BACL|nr:hypothetical protein [Paenibacillus aceti]GGF86649.1 hypothetical protein GCM10010913_05200 [Paenibacillus aceti]
MNGYVKLPVPFLYQVDSCYQFVICTKMIFEPQSLQTTLRGKLYSYESEDLRELGTAEVVIDGKENIVMQLDENGNYID